MLDGLELLHLPVGGRLKLIHIHRGRRCSARRSGRAQAKYEKYLAEHPTKFKVDFELKGMARMAPKMK